jgi:diguanylate cyclase (GGDEF)-like protein
MRSNLRITLISGDQQLAAHLQLRLQSKDYQVILLSSFTNVIGMIYSDPPDLIILDLSSSSLEAGDKIVNTIRGDSFFSTIPIIGILTEISTEEMDWSATPLDDFITLPIKYPELFSRIQLAMGRIERIFDNNPLTRLPGNASIQRAVEAVMGTPMAVCYIDINNFKPYNDVYGFSHGDEVLRMLARIMFNAVKESGGGFCGHIGGDDFVFIVPTEQSEPVCKTIISNFGQIADELFDDVAKADGFFLACDRKGQEEKIPLLSISIAVVPTDSPRILHYGKLTEVAAELKKLAKRSSESSYVVDKRR